jgi:hypothetical protein
LLLVFFKGKALPERLFPILTAKGKPDKTSSAAKVTSYPVPLQMQDAYFSFWLPLVQNFSAL